MLNPAVNTLNIVPLDLHVAHLGPGASCWGPPDKYHQDHFAVLHHVYMQKGRELAYTS